MISITKPKYRFGLHWLIELISTDQLILISQSGRHPFYI